MHVNRQTHLSTQAHIRHHPLPHAPYMYPTPSYLPSPHTHALQKLHKPSFACISSSSLPQLLAQPPAAEPLPLAAAGQTGDKKPHTSSQRLSVLSNKSPLKQLGAYSLLEPTKRKLEPTSNENHNVLSVEHSNTNHIQQSHPPTPRILHTHTPSLSYSHSLSHSHSHSHSTPSPSPTPTPASPPLPHPFLVLVESLLSHLPRSPQCLPQLAANLTAHQGGQGDRRTREDHHERVHAHAREHSCMHTHAHTHKHMRTHTNTHAHAHAHTHTHTHTHTFMTGFTVRVVYHASLKILCTKKETPTEVPIGAEHTRMHAPSLHLQKLSNPRETLLNLLL